jgi:hypothetical protein
MSLWDLSSCASGEVHLEDGVTTRDDSLDRTDDPAREITPCPASPSTTPAGTPSSTISVRPSRSRRTKKQRQGSSVPIRARFGTPLKSGLDPVESLQNRSVTRPEIQVPKRRGSPAFREDGAPSNGIAVIRENPRVLSLRRGTVLAERWFSSVCYGKALLWASPPPRTARSGPRGFSVEGHAPPPPRFPTWRRIPVCRHATAHTPVGPLERVAS